MFVVHKFPLEVHEEYFGSDSHRKEIDCIVVKNWYNDCLNHHPDLEHIFSVLVERPKGLNCYRQKHKETQNIEIWFSSVLFGKVDESSLNASYWSENNPSQEEVVEEKGHVFDDWTSLFFQVGNYEQCHHDEDDHKQSQNVCASDAQRSVEQQIWQGSFIRWFR